MKLVKGLVSLLLSVSAAPLLAVEAPEMNIEHSIVINAPPDVVWDFVSDFNGLPRWLSTITESRACSSGYGLAGSMMTSSSVPTR